MGSRVNAPLPPMEVKTVDGPRPPLTPPARSGQSPSIALTAVVRDVLIRHYGSLKAAALTFEMDLGQLSRELQTGDFKFRRLDDHADVKVAIARAMYQTFGDDDPQARKRRVIRRLREGLEELAEIEGAA